MTAGLLRREEIAKRRPAAEDMKNGVAAHRAAASGLFCAFCLLAVALGLAGARPLSLAMGGSLLSLFLFTRESLRSALGEFLAPLAIVVDLGLLFCAMSLTGGAGSPYALLLPAGLALAWFQLGRGAAWFFAAASLLGVAALVTLGHEPLSDPARAFPLLLAALAAPGLLAALEAARKSHGPDTAGQPRARTLESAEPAVAVRNREAEMLHDLRSPLSVMRVYSDLIGESARRGEIPSAEYLANLSREIALAERLAGGPPAGGANAFAPGTQSTADLVEILGSLATAYRLSHGGRLRLEFIAERPQLPVTADPVSLQRAFRNAEIRDEHTANPQFCNAADNSQSPIVASIAAENVAGGIQVVADRRGEAVPGAPAYYGQAQAVQAINNLHYSRYCSETEAQAGLCAQGEFANADQHAANLFGSGTYVGQDGVNTANDFKTNLLQPIVPAALRADQLTSLNGQDALPRRRSYNARMSLAGSVISYAIAVQSPSVPLTAQQQQQQRAEGLPVQAAGSWLTAVSLEVNRRMSDAGWHASLQAMPPASLQREIAVQLALSNYLAMQNYRLGLYQASLSATQVAQSEEGTFREAVQMPSPNMAGN